MEAVGKQEVSIARYENHVHGLLVVVQIGKREVSIWDGGQWEVAEYAPGSGGHDDRRVIDFG